MVVPEMCSRSAAAVLPLVFASLAPGKRPTAKPERARRRGALDSLEEPPSRRFFYI